jgi:beta-phosphoglucomutase-like phosphatase (HAD superfamily)
MIMNSHAFTAAILDLDSVITRTAKVRTRAWARRWNRVDIEIGDDDRWCGGVVPACQPC